MSRFLPAQPLNNLNDISYPVANVADKTTESQKVKIHKIGGTCFYGGHLSEKRHVFITAGHVLAQLRESRDRWTGGKLAITAFDGQKGRYPIVVRAIDEEIIEDYDVGVMICEAPIEAILRFPAIQKGDMPALHDTFTAGYPDALNPELKILTARSYKGYIIASRPFTVLPGKPRCYELSFPAPRGLSGAPLMANWHNQPTLIGMILGVEKSRYSIVGETVESIAENDNAQIRRVTEEAVLQTVAIQIQELIELESSIVGSRLGELLWNRDYCLQEFKPSDDKLKS